MMHEYPWDVRRVPNYQSAPSVDYLVSTVGDVEARASSVASVPKDRAA